MNRKVHAGFASSRWGSSTVKKLTTSASSDWNVIGCELESDARRIMDVLPKRFGRFGLTIHPQKTQLVFWLQVKQRKELSNLETNMSFAKMG